jgi:hypothetical protein
VSEPSDSSVGATPAPILGALAIVVAVLIVIGLLNVFSSDELTDDQQIRRAVVAQNDALQRQDYADFRQYTCVEQQGVESKVITGQRDSSAKLGERFIDSATNVAIDGEKATADVTYHFDKFPDDEETAEIAFVRQDGAWKVCSTGPK